jgi:hypothetical protein
MSFWTTIGDAIAAQLMPVVEEKGKQLLTTAETKAEELLGRVIDTVQAEIEKRIPALTAALVTAVTQAAGNAIVRGEDKVTDMIPGTLDDAVLDPIVKNAMDIFTNLTRGH